MKVQRWPGHFGMNEGHFPNFALHWKGYWFVYICLGPYLRWHWYRER
jgi:hypothetical protein